jgi:hypothetical protein
VYARRRAAAFSAIAIVAVGVALGTRPGSSALPARAATRTVRAAANTTRSVPPLVVRAPSGIGPNWTRVARVDGVAAAWIAQRGAVTLLRFDQNHVHLTLHTGSLDGGTVGWTYGDQITTREIHLLVAGFNGGFKLTYSNVGFMSNGHVAVGLKPDLASIVTYANGTSDIGAWGQGVPAAGEQVFSVLQNQQLLVNNGIAAATVSTCIITCWGATVGGVTTVARSGLGITASGQLVWAAGEQLTPDSLAQAFIDAGAVRAIELDINPDWVAGYLYVHHRTGPVPSPVVPGQVGIYGQLLAPDARDFFAVVAN